jgi:hypothetical protein
MLRVLPITIGTYEPQIVEWCNGSISDSESDDIASNPISITNVGFSLFGKALHCECKEQGSRPGVNQRNNEQEILNGEEQGILNDEVKK